MLLPRCPASFRASLRTGLSMASVMFCFMAAPGYHYNT